MAVLTFLSQGKEFYESIKPPAEIAYLTTNSAIFFVAFSALIFARGQVREANRQNNQAEHARSATVFLEIEERWHSDRISSARKAVFEIMSQFKKSEKDFALAGFQRYLALEASLDEVTNLVNLLQFTENIGLLVDREYVSLDDVDSLIGSAVIQIGGLFGKHIADKRSETGSITLYAHTLTLVRKIEGLRAAQNA